MRGLYTALLFVLLAIMAFCLGILTERGYALDPISVEMRPVVMEAQKADIQASVNETGRYVASKNGTKYHLASCPGARTIAEANKVWFDTKETAESAGYAPASNCPGI